MPARTTLLIIFLTLFTSALVVYSLILDSNKTTMKTQTKTITPTVTPIAKNASYSFDPSIATVSSSLSTSGKTDVILNATGNPVTDVQVELSYDPKVITSVTLATPSSSLWQQASTDYQELYKNVDPVNGRISYIASVKQNTQPVTGIGPILSIDYKVNPATIGTGTTIKMLDKSLVMQEGSNESVLGSKQDFTISSMLPTRPANASSSGQTVTPSTP